MMNAMEYGIMHKILLASDFLSGTIDNVITGLPTIPTEMQVVFIYENWKQFFP